MEIKKGQIVEVEHSRKGYFVAKASSDFDTDVAGFYPLILVTRLVQGMSTSWEEGEEIPCRNSLCKLKVLV